MQPRRDAPPCHVSDIPRPQYESSHPEEARLAFPIPCSGIDLIRVDHATGNAKDVEAVPSETDGFTTKTGRGDLAYYDVRDRLRVNVYSTGHNQGSLSHALLR